MITLTPRPVPAGTSVLGMEVAAAAVRRASAAAIWRGVRDVRHFRVTDSEHGWGRRVIWHATSIDVFVPPTGEPDVLVVHRDHDEVITTHHLQCPDEHLLGDLVLALLPAPPQTSARSALAQRAARQ